MGTLKFVRLIFELKVAKKRNDKQSKNFITQALRYYAVGASGLIINFLVCLLLTSGIISKFSYSHALFLGINVSIISNFLLNKYWTFKDRNFSPLYALRQFALFVISNLIGASIQLAIVYISAVQSGIPFMVALLVGVLVGSTSNFVLNKMITFKVRIWS